jgi:hypothetical protein
MSKVLIDGVRYVPAQPLPVGKGLMDALDLRFSSDAGDDLTVRQYLHEIFRLVWDSPESFDGKRPFGNSGWEYDLYFPLARAGFIDLGTFDEDGDPYNWTQEQINIAHAYVHDLIAASMFGTN